MQAFVAGKSFVCSTVLLLLPCVLVEREKSERAAEGVPDSNRLGQLWTKLLTFSTTIPCTVSASASDYMVIALQAARLTAPASRLQSWRSPRPWPRAHHRFGPRAANAVNIGCSSAMIALKCACARPLYGQASLKFVKFCIRIFSPS